jgi:multicomponent Na+:H+ antiporter subunit E
MTISWQSVLAGVVGWYTLSGGAPNSWFIGGPVIVIVAAAVGRWRPEPAHSVQWLAVPPFVAFFLSRSLVAGVDVARRTLSPVMPLSPSVVMYHTRLPAGAPRVLLAGTISLLPGSLSVSMNEERLAVHVLDRMMDTAGDLSQVEQRIAAIFGQAAT